MFITQETVKESLSLPSGSPEAQMVESARASVASAGHLIRPLKDAHLHRQGIFFEEITFDPGGKMMGKSWSEHPEQQGSRCKGPVAGTNGANKRRSAWLKH